MGEEHEGFSLLVESQVYEYEVPLAPALASRRRASLSSSSRPRAAKGTLTNKAKRTGNTGSTLRPKAKRRRTFV